MESEEFIALFLKYRDNRCNTEEVERLIRYIQSGRDRNLIEQLIGGLAQAEIGSETFETPGVRESLERVFSRVQQAKREKQLKPRGIRRMMVRWASVAAVFIAAVSVFWYFAGEDNVSPDTVNLKAADIAPGGNRATLTLADGRTIALSEAQAGIVMDDAQITYQDGSASVAVLEEGNTTEPVMLSLTTPKGGTYQVTLPDGSKVWLNAASTLTYPSHFGGKMRSVTLSGEGYFNVAKDEQKPFRVISRDQEVKVLGTQFNLSAYPDEAATKTTLVEGAVQLGGGDVDVRLSPGEQGILTNGKIQVATVDVATYVGWKNDEFVFNGIELRDAMKQLSRWYDVEVIYEGKIPPKQFYGSFSRNLTLGETLDILKEARVNFSVQKVGSVSRLVVTP